MSAKEVIIKYHGDIARVERELGAKLELLGADYAVLTLEEEQIPLLYAYSQIEYVELPKILSLTLRQSAAAACIPAVQAENNYGLKGRGVLIGIIDTGIDYTLEDFRDGLGNSRVLYLWDQTLNGKPPQGFLQGSEYNNGQLNAALASANPLSVVASADTLGHGTAVAGIAAGKGQETGVAPEAALAIVKLGYKGNSSFARTTQVMRAVKYLLDKAQLLNMPLVINLSFGTNEGSHDGSSLFETYLDAMALRWKTVIVVAAGNEGAAGHHFAGRVDAGQFAAADFSVTAHLDSLYLTWWQNFADTFTLQLIAPNGSIVGEISSGQPAIFREMGGFTVNMYYGQPNHYSVAQEAYFWLRRGQNSILRGIWRIGVRGVQVVDGNFDIWLPTLEEVGAGAVFSIPQPQTTITLPATANRVISVGGYNSPLEAFAPFSGRGYTRKLAVKPDLVAPAVNIRAPRPGGAYDTFTGTSMAAPFVSGSAALLMQWGIVQGQDPFLYGQRIKALLRKAARRRAFISYPNPQWGYGELCLENTLKLLNT